MLVLTRKLMERLYIGDEICVTVVRLEGGQVRLGIDAPRHIPVVRAELIPEREVEGSVQTPRAEHANPHPHTNPNTNIRPNRGPSNGNARPTPHRFEFRSAPPPTGPPGIGNRRRGPSR